MQNKETIKQDLNILAKERGLEVTQVFKEEDYKITLKDTKNLKEMKIEISYECIQDFVEGQDNDRKNEIDNLFRNVKIKLQQ